MSQLLKNKMKIALAQLNPKVGDIKGNISKLISIRNDLSNDVDMIVVPELYVTGYPIDDLVLRNDFLELCLLYTSPSPRDRYGSRMPSSA